MPDIVLGTRDTTMSKIHTYIYIYYMKCFMTELKYLFSKILSKIKEISSVSDYIFIIIVIIVLRRKLK